MKIYKIKLATLATLLVTFTTVKAQKENNLLDIPGEVITGSNLLTTTKRTINGVIGSPYMNDNFEPALIGDFKNSTLIRYDIFNDNIEFLRNGQTIILNKDNSVDRIKYTNNNLNLRLIKNQYYVVLGENNNVLLLKKEIIKLTDARVAINSYTEDKPAEFEKDKPKYFLYKNNNLLELSKKANLDNYFQNKEIGKFIKQNKINFTNEGSLLKLFNYIVSQN